MKTVQTAAAGDDPLLYLKQFGRNARSGGRASGARLGGPQVGVVCVCVIPPCWQFRNACAKELCVFCTCYIVSVRFLFCLHSGDIFTLGMLTCGCWHKSKGVFEGSSLVLTVRSLDKGYSADTVCVCVCVYVIHTKGLKLNLVWL